MDGQHGERKLLHTVQHHAYEVITLNTEGDELVGQRIGVAVHLAIGELAILIDDGRGIGSALCLFGEEIGKGLAQVNVERFAGTQPDDALRLCLAHNTDAVQRCLGLRHHALQRHRHRIGQSLHHAGGIFPVVIVDTHAAVGLRCFTGGG